MQVQEHTYIFVQLSLWGLYIDLNLFMHPNPNPYLNLTSIHTLPESLTLKFNVKIVRPHTVSVNSDFGPHIYRETHTDTHTHTNAPSPRAVMSLYCLLCAMWRSSNSAVQGIDQLKESNSQPDAQTLLTRQILMEGFFFF